MNKSPNKSFSGFSNFGFSTIVFSFAMICVITFSILAFTTANADYKLSKKVAEKNAAYDLAEEQAYAHIAEIEDILCNAYLDNESSEEYYLAIERALQLQKGTFGQEDMYYTYAFTETVSDSLTLEIRLELCYPATLDDVFLKIIEFRSVPKEVVPEDDFLDLIN